MPKSRVNELNEQIQNELAILIFNPEMQQEDEENMDAYDEMLTLLIQVLDFLYKSNINNPRVPSIEFQNPTCSDNLNMTLIAKQYYTSKQSKKKSAEDKFVFLDYPWLFSTAAKVEVIQKESKFNMKNTLHQMLDDDGHLTLEHFLNIDQVLHLQIQVRRTYLLEDSLRMLSAQSKNYKKPLKIKFFGEEGVDQGGVKKEFFTLLMKELFNPGYAMFEQKFNDRFLWFNKLSVECNINFELIGTLLALAIYNSVLLSAPFPRVVYKKLLNETTDLEVANMVTIRISKNLNRSSIQR
jgi:ubiquitin-protein ligase E3 A